MAATPKDDKKREANERLFTSLLELGALTVDENGHIWLTNGERAETNSGGYLVVSLNIAKRQFQIRAHRLVYLASYGTIPAGLQINHRNNISSDNRLENLELATNRQNVKHGLRFQPSKDEIVRHVRRKLAETKVQSRLGLQVGEK